MMPSASETNGRRKSEKIIFRPKQKRLLKKQTRNWLDLPTDVMANILQRVGAFDILENAQKVCTTWHKICKDPAMWRVIHMENFDDPSARPGLRKMCMHAVDRSQGQLVNICMIDFADEELLLYIADRSSQLRCLEIAYCYGLIYPIWPEALKKLPLLEELSIHITDMSKEGIEAAGRYCPLLKTLKYNLREGLRYESIDYDEKEYNKEAKAIGENLPQLRHLELIGNTMLNFGLKAILDGCRHLESLDLRLCFNINLGGHLGKRCSEQIKYLKLPNGSLEGCQYTYESDWEASISSSDSESDSFWCRDRTHEQLSLSLAKFCALSNSRSQIVYSCGAGLCIIVKYNSKQVNPQVTEAVCIVVFGLLFTVVALL